MSQTVLSKGENDSRRVASFGSDLRFTDWEQVSLDRISGAPLCFSARRIARHWSRLYSGEPVSISLWQHKKPGFAMSFTVCVAGQLTTQSVVADSLSESICYLEDYCSGLPEPAPMGKYLMDSILNLQRIVEFSDVFLTLAGETLSTWIDYDQNPDIKLLHHKATA